MSAATRMLMFEVVCEEWNAETDDEPNGAIRHPWALVQYNGGRAPNEKWVTVHPTPEAACTYAANDEEWEPEVIVDLDTGQVWGTERIVRLVEPTRTLRPPDPSLKP